MTTWFQCRAALELQPTNQDSQVSIPGLTEQCPDSWPVLSGRVEERPSWSSGMKYAAGNCDMLVAHASWISLEMHVNANMCRHTCLACSVSSTHFPRFWEIQTLPSCSDVRLQQQQELMFPSQMVCRSTKHHRARRSLFQNHVHKSLHT